MDQTVLAHVATVKPNKYAKNNPKPGLVNRGRSQHFVTVDYYHHDV